MNKRYIIYYLAFISLLYSPHLYASTNPDNNLSDSLELDRSDYLEDSLTNAYYPQLQLITAPVSSFAGTARPLRSRASDPESPIDNPNIPQHSIIDYNKEVGEIEIISGTSPTGAKTYDIPLKICPARHDFAPQLALSYNSQRGNSSVGVGWSVSGLTEITRIGKTFYYDSKTEGIRMNNTDAFAINGTRLIKQSETSDYILYQSETGNIMVKGHISGDVMCYFEVFYPDGTYGTCGYTTNIYNDICYPQMSLTDLWGNEIQYFYTYNEGHFSIFKIMYSGGTIDFVYQSDRLDNILTYRGGKEMLENRLLSQIICKRGNSTLGTYGLSYTEYFGLSHLTKIDYTADGDSLNPLCFYYNQDTYQHYYASGQTQLRRYHNMTSLNSVKAIVGRFDYQGNRDGLIVYPTRPAYYDKNASGKHVYRNKYTGNEKIFLYTNLDSTEAHVDSIDTSTDFVDILCADLSGTGQEDIVKVRNYMSGGRDCLSFYVYTITDDGCYHYKYSRLFDVGAVYTSPKGYKSVSPKTFHVGDFDGDGKMEVLVMGGHPSGGSSYYPTSCHIYNLTTGQILFNTPLLSEYELHFFGDWETDLQSIANGTDKLIVIDYDGDGKSDLCHIGNSLTKVYTFNSTTAGLTSSLVYTNYGLLKSRVANSDMLVGDFNGDGLTDVFVTAPVGSAEDTHSQVFNSTGSGWFKSHDAGYIRKHVNQEYGMLAQDVNCDGITDVTQYATTGFSTSIFLGNNPDVEFRYGASFYNNQPSKFIPIYINTRNSRPRFLTLNNGTVTYYQFPYNQTLEAMMVGMKNSFGIIEKHEYKTLTEEWDSLPPNAVTQTSNPEFPYIKLQEPLVVLSRSELYKDDSRIDYTRYNYGNAFFHRQGLGFRGFDALVQSNYRGHTFIQTFDPFRMGVPIESFTPQSHSAYQYTVNVAADKLTKVLLDSKVETDSLTGETSNTTFTYDSQGYPTQENTSYPTSPDITITKSFSYSSNSNVGIGYHLGYPNSIVTTTTKGGDTFVESNYSPVTEKRQPIIASTSKNGNTVSTTTYSYDSYGAVTSEAVKSFTSSNSVQTSYQYDIYGQRDHVIDPLGHTSLYLHDSLGRLERVYDARGNYTYYAYDAFGRESSVVMPDSTVKTITREWVHDVEGALYVVTSEETGKPKIQTYYDALGREVRTRQQRFNGTYNKVDRQYDTYGRLLKVSMPYKGANPLWNSYTYDEFDRITALNEASGRSTTYNYNGLSTTTTEDSISTTRTYDVLGNLEEVEDPAGNITYEIAADGQPISITAPGNITTSFTYDQYRRRTAISDPSAGTTTYTYDSAGNLATETNANGQTTTYSYDQFGRLTTATYPEMTVSQSYNTYGDLASVSSTNGVSRLMTYDSYGRLSTWKEMVDSVWLQKGYSYASNNVSAISYTSHKGLLATENYSYSNGYLTDIAKDGTLSLFQLTSENMLGLPTGVTTLNLTRTYSYTPFGLPTGRTASGPSSTIYDESYSFDATTSNLLSRTDNRRNLTEQFTYDNLHRLTASDSAVVQFDIKGNITGKSNVGTFSYDNAQKPYAVTGASAVSGTISTNTQDITFYSFRRPRQIAEGQFSLDFTYNGDLNRVKEEVKQNGVTIETRYSLGGCYDYIVGTSVNQTEEDLYLAGGYYDAPILLQKYDDGSSYISHLVRDYQGSIVSIVDSTGFWHNDYSYDAWGRPRNPHTHVVYNPSILNYYSSAYRGYCGHEHLPQFGLINMNARLYDPALGRFLSPDPYVQLPDFSQSFNRYSYCLNNPLKYVDEDGEWFVELLLAMGSQAVIGAVQGGIGYSVSAAVNKEWNWNSFGNTVAFGAVSGALGGLCNYLSSLFPLAGISVNQFGYSFMCSTFNHYVTSAIFNRGSSWKDIFPIIASSSLSAITPNYKASNTNWFNNSLKEIGFNTARNALVGFYSGIVDAGINQDVNRLWQNTVGGAVSGASRTIAMNLIFGAPYKPQVELEHEGLYRSGGIASLFSAHGNGLTMGRNVYVNGKYDENTEFHENYHIYQQNTMGWSVFYVKMTSQYLGCLTQLKHPSNCTLEQEAYKYADKKAPIKY